MGRSEGHDRLDQRRVGTDAFKRLRQRIEAQPTLTSILEAVLAYPAPHWYLYEYQVDCILRDDLAVEELVDAVRTLSGRHFEAERSGCKGHIHS